MGYIKFTLILLYLKQGDGVIFPEQMECFRTVYNTNGHIIQSLL